MNEVINECRLCESTGPHQTVVVREMYFGTRELFEYYNCAACGTLMILNALEGQELMRYYPADYYSFIASAQPKVLRWLTTQQDRFELNTGGRLIGALMARLPAGARAFVATRDASGDVVRMLGRMAVEPNARILDVGCGAGALLDRLARAGFNNLSGVDPFIAADGETSEGVALTKQYLSELNGGFDLIMFNHSLEHVPDPVATLKAAYEKLADGGICLVRLPTTSSEVWEIYREHWAKIDAPKHIVIPSRRGMALTAEALGFRVEKTFDDSNSSQFFASEAYRRDIAAAELGGLWDLFRIFGVKQVWDWEKRSERLNMQSRGDQTGFILRK